jgi:DNA-binding PadR family transcriptional regulator
VQGAETPIGWHGLSESPTWVRLSRRAAGRSASLASSPRLLSAPAVLSALEREGWLRQVKEEAPQLVYALTPQGRTALRRVQLQRDRELRARPASSPSAQPVGSPSAQLAGSPSEQSVEVFETSTDRGLLRVLLIEQQARTLSVRFEVQDDLLSDSEARRAIFTAVLFGERADAYRRQVDRVQFTNVQSGAVQVVPYEIAD